MCQAIRDVPYRKCDSSDVIHERVDCRIKSCYNKGELERMVFNETITTYLKFMYQCLLGVHKFSIKVRTHYEWNAHIHGVIPHIIYVECFTDTIKYTYVAKALL